MTFFSLPNHITGLMGLPRRVYDATYGGAPQAQMWSELTAISAAGGIIVFTSALCFVLSIGKTLLRKPSGAEEALVWAEPLEHDDARLTMWDSLGRWWILAVVLVIIAYAIPLMDIFRMTRFGSPGFKPF